MLNEESTRRIADTRHADSAWAWQVANVCSVTGLQNCADRSCELHYQDAPVRVAPDSTPVAGNVDPAEFAEAHDAHMRSVYAEPWDMVPTGDPRTGDPLTGHYGRTYAESGWMLMQAARDMFGPFSGHCPILLFQATTTDGRPLIHGAMGGCVLTHVDTHDTWDGALRAMRTRIDGTLAGTPIGTTPVPTCGTCGQARGEHCPSCDACPINECPAWCTKDSDYLD